MNVFFALYLLLALYLLISQVGSSTATCNQSEKSHKSKVSKSPIVVIAKFVKLIRNETDASMSIANFRLERRLKGQLLHNSDGTFNVPMLRGHNSMSKKFYCINENMLKVDERYVLFLNHERNGSSLEWKVIFLPEVFNKNKEGVMYDLDHPFFELVVDTSTSPDASSSKRAEVRIGDPLYLRCTVKGETHPNPSISWNHRGSQINEEQNDKKVETDKRTLISTLKINRFEPSHEGPYECTVRRKDGVKTYTKMRVDIQKNLNYTTLFDEQLCNENYTDWCKHGGICLVHNPTKTMSCRCQQGFHGPRCEFSTLIYRDTKKPPLQAEYNKNVITVGVVIGLALILSFSAFILFLKHKFRKVMEDRNDDQVRSNLINTYINQGSLKNDSKKGKLKEDQRNHLPQYCAKCWQEIHQLKEKSPTTPNKPLIEIRRASFADEKKPNLTYNHSIYNFEELQRNSLPGYLKLPDCKRPSDAKYVLLANGDTKKRRFGTSDENLESPSDVLSEKRTNAKPFSNHWSSEPSSPVMNLHKKEKIVSKELKTRQPSDDGSVHLSLTDD